MRAGVFVSREDTETWERHSGRGSTPSSRVMSPPQIALGQGPALRVADHRFSCASSSVCLLDHGQDVAGRVLEPRDGRAGAAHDASLIRFEAEAKPRNDKAPGMGARSGGAGNRSRPCGGTRRKGLGDRGSYVEARLRPTSVRCAPVARLVGDVPTSGAPALAQRPSSNGPEPSPHMRPKTSRKVAC